MCQRLTRLLLRKNGFLSVRCASCCCCTHRRAATCSCECMWVTERQIGSGPFLLYNRREGFLCSLQKPFSLFFQMAACSQGTEEQCCVCSFSYSVVYPVLQYLRVCIFMPVHAQTHKCVCAFWEHIGVLYLIRASISILPSSLQLCYAAATVRTVAIHWWMVSVMSQHAVFFCQTI